MAPPEISGGTHIGPAAINRGDYNWYVEDTWKASPTLTLDYGVRWEYYTPITERAKRTGSPRVLNGKMEYLVNPQPGYSTTWNGWGPRVQASWAPVKNLTAHLGVAVTVIPPNIWQDNMLTGSTPFVIYPRRQSTSSAPLAYGFTVTPSTLPIAYDLSTRLASISMRAIVTEEEVNPLRDPITGPLIAAR
ncbi:MAG: Oar protein [Edaphobacter sp.]|nr:Oar protein [Edaphobacter sp.]